MKNLKFLLLVSLSMLFLNQANAQNPLQAYGHTAYSNRTVQERRSFPYANVAMGFDTVTATDTAFYQIQYPNVGYAFFDLNVTSITGTLAGTAVLQGAYGSTMPNPISNQWHTLTASTTYCTGCVGASATLSGSGTTTYEWHMPLQGLDYQNYQIRAIVTGTCTATGTVTSNYKN
jgi:hypothetical protein